MDPVYTFNDPDGDRLEVDTVNRDGMSAFVWTSVGGVVMTAAQVDDLRAALEPFGTKPEPAALKVGDKAVVTGDSAEWGHDFEVGTVVSLVHESDNDLGRSGNRGGWLCADTRGDGEEWTWNVHTSDLAPLPAPLPAPVELIAEPPLDEHRVAALEKARELAPRTAFGAPTPTAVLSFARFLLDEESGE